MATSARTRPRAGVTSGRSGDVAVMVLLSFQKNLVPARPGSPMVVRPPLGLHAPDSADVGRLEGSVGLPGLFGGLQPSRH